MTRSRKPAPEIGDIIEIETPVGLAYAQYSHDDARGKMGYGELIRVLPGVYQQRPDDLSSLAQGEESFYVFFSVKAALKQGMVKWAGHSPLPKRCRPFPLMKAAGAIDPSGRVLNWWLFDGKKYWRVDRLTPEQERLSIAQWWSPAALAQRIAEGWSPSDDVTRRGRESSPDRASTDDAKSNGGSGGGQELSGDERAIEEMARAGADLVTPRAVRHYLYVPTRKAASEAKRRLTPQGFEVEIREGAEGDWLVLASHNVILSLDGIERTRAALETIASELRGEYDGWEASVHE